MRFVSSLIVPLALLAGCSSAQLPDADISAEAEKAVTLAAEADIGDPVWLEVRSLAQSAAGQDDLADQMAGLIGKSMVLGPDRADLAAAAEPYLLQAVETDDSYHWLLAQGYQNGWYGNEPDPGRGCTHYKLAADANLNGAYWPLGLCYLNGTGVDQDPEQAFAWMQKSANAGDQNGMVTLAVLHATGQGTEKDADMAATWYDTAARSDGPNLAHALRGLGAMHLFGELGEASIQPRGYALLELARDLGDPAAASILGRVAALDAGQQEAVQTHKEFVTNFYKLREREGMLIPG